MPKFFFGLTGINAFMDLCLCFFFSSEIMSSEDSPPRVKQRIEESVADRLHRMQSRQVLYERNLLRADLRDPVLLPIAQMLLENNWECLYNCACQAFPRLVREFYGHMIIIQDDDRGLIMQTMVRGQTILIDPQLISSVIGVPILLVSGVPFLDEALSIDFLHDFFGTRPQREDMQVTLLDQYRCFCSYAPILGKGCCHKHLASSSSE